MTTNVAALITRDGSLDKSAGLSRSRAPRREKQSSLLRNEIDEASMFEEIVGASPAIRAVLRRVSKVATTSSTVLITGETGTGKELIARAIHKRSQRSSHAPLSGPTKRENPMATQMIAGDSAKAFYKLLTCGAVLLPLIAAGNAAADGKQDEELQLGKEAFAELKAKGEIIESSPLYDLLQPIADAISRAAQPQYNHPFKFYLVHEAQPNAFAVPGGNVYVVDSLLYFVRNTEQLAGTLCHEVSHTIHRDSMALMKKHERTIRREVGAAVLLGPTRAHVLAIALLGKLRSLGYSREAESHADLTGSDICAQAGYNPWGLVWLFEDFKNARKGEIPQLLSDHPADQNRIDAVTRHMRDNPSTFAKYSRDRQSATPFSAPKGAPVVFMR